MSRPPGLMRPFCVLLAAAMPLLASEFPETQAAPDAPGVSNWAAPLFWKPAAPPRVLGDVRPEEASVASPPLPFIAITPCRVADTRGNGFTGQYGPPALVANATRTFTITGQCGIPGSAAAVSFNFAALNVGAAGDLRVFPAGGGVPLVSTLNYNASTPNIANAAVVPIGTGGAITVQADAVAIDLIIDVNGYYDGNGVITGVTPGTGMTGGGTSGSVSLGIAAGGVTSTELASNAVTSSKIAANAVTAGAIASGQVVKNVNGVTDGVTVAGSGGASVSTVGSTITVGVPGFVPSGSFVLGNPGDTTLIGAGYTELAASGIEAWRPTATAGAPTARDAHTMVWTGTKMIVWGGHNGPSVNTGGQYDPATDSWSATTTTGAPAARRDHTAVWTGSKMIVWGGTDAARFNTGGQYDPAGNSWTATTTTGAPSARSDHTAVWTGSKMIVWGGVDGPTSFNTGGQYDPAGNSWTATTTTGAPTARSLHKAVWTGTKMIVWGGAAPAATNTGGQYDPTGDSWSATSTSVAPSARTLFTAIWTGSRMIVWGGSPTTNTGGLYDPVGDSWSTTSVTGAVPAARFFHTAVWTGSKMIVWGGDTVGGVTNTGGQFDPSGNTGGSWSTTTTAGAPTVRDQHTAVWTGSRMIVWGGSETDDVNTGGQYSNLSLYVKN